MTAMDAVDKATAWRAEIDAEHPAVDRVAEVLQRHVPVLDVWPSDAAAFTQCECGHLSASDDAAVREQGHHIHVAEQLAAAGLLNP